MCRSDIHPAAREQLGNLLTSMATKLADSVGANPDEVVIGPVDFGAEDGER